MKTRRLIGIQETDPPRLANVFKKYNKSARSTAWNSIEKNPRTKDLMRKLVLSPDRPIHGTSTLLTFKEWMKSQ